MAITVLEEHRVEESKSAFYFCNKIPEIINLEMKVSLAHGSLRVTDLELGVSKHIAVCHAGWSKLLTSWWLRSKKKGRGAEEMAKRLRASVALLEDWDSATSILMMAHNHL